MASAVEAADAADASDAADDDMADDGASTDPGGSTDPGAAMVVGGRRGGTELLAPTLGAPKLRGMAAKVGVALGVELPVALDASMCAGTRGERRLPRSCCERLSS